MKETGGECDQRSECGSASSEESPLEGSVWIAKHQRQSQAVGGAGRQVPTKPLYPPLPAGQGEEK